MSKFAIRQLLKDPGSIVVAVFALAVCVVANLVIFGAIDAVLVRNLPFPTPDQLVTMFRTG